MCENGYNISTVIAGNVECFKYAIEKGRSPASFVLGFAAQLGNLELVKCLLDNGFEWKLL
jgi:hypothetical protein